MTPDEVTPEELAEIEAQREEDANALAAWYTPKGVTEGEPIGFENLGFCFWEKVGFRAPRKGEYYLSGAIVAGWRAFSDMDFPYHVVKPTHRAVRTVMRQAFKPGERV
jgi:hypothetical protein